MNAISKFLDTLEPSMVIDLHAGDYLFRQNDRAKGIFLVRQGRIKLIRDTIDGNLVIMHIAQVNDSFAEASLFASHYHCHAKSDNQAQVCLYKKEQILSSLSSSTNITLGFMEALTKQIQHLRLLIELRGIRSPRERLIQYLQLMVDSERTLTVKTTLKDLSITLGMTHETLYRILRQLENDNIIIRDENRLLLQI